MERKRTMQEEFWAGEFGDSYVDRNVGEKIVASNTALFSKILQHTYNIESVLELGANIGLNMIALHSLLPSAHMSAVEINSKAAERLSKLGYVDVYNGSIYDDYVSNKSWDFVFTKGVLIHQNPEMLQKAYETLYNASNRYIMVAEYYNPAPAEVTYRGNDSVLFKRDFAGEILDKYDDLELVDYGFAYHRDNNFPADDFNWFLLKKQ